MLELLLLAAVGVGGYFLGRHTAPCTKDHTAMIATMAFLQPGQRMAILMLPSVPAQALPGPAQGLTKIIPPIPLFNDDEKKAVLQEVAQWQKDHADLGFPAGTAVSADEIALKYKPAPPAAAPAMRGIWN